MYRTDVGLEPTRPPTRIFLLHSFAELQKEGDSLHIPFGRLFKRDGAATKNTEQGTSVVVKPIYVPQQEGVCGVTEVFKAMPLSTQEQAAEENYVLATSLDNVRNLSNILKAIHFKDHATCFATTNGLKVTVENSKCLQANAFIQAGIFQEFAVQEESMMFRINLSVLLDCLTIFGTSSLPGTQTALRMCYRGYGYPLTLFLEEAGVVTVCKINTQEPEEILDFDFCSTNVVNKIILKSEGLREAFSELDMTSEVLEIIMSPDKPYLRLSTFGNSGSTHLDYPKDSDLIEAFNCNQTQTNRYKISLLKPSIKALALSCKVSIRTDNRGFLSLQYMIRNEDGQICFVEYYCCPDEDVTEVEM